MQTACPRKFSAGQTLVTTSSVTGGNGITYAWCVQINYNAVPYSPYPNETYTQNNNLGYTATLLWNRTYNPIVASGNLTYILGPVDYQDQVFTVWAKETRQWYGFSLKDGSQLWGPTSSAPPYNLYNAVARMDAGGASTAYGMLYQGGYGGELDAYNMTTGKLVWSYTATGIATESPYGNYPLDIGAIADGKLFLYTDLGYVQQPLWRGAAVRAINAYTGQEVWQIYGWAIDGVVVADGYAFYGDQYNNMMDCVGKGPSATTVTATPKVAASGTQVLVEGTVTDQSPGAPGTPAISEQYMEQWMEYLYEQQSKPTNATGVPVTLTAVDPNGNTDFIGNATSDITGNYAIAWTPPVPGLYTITATFAGSASYGNSAAETHVVVSPAASPAAIITPSPTVQPTSTPIQTPIQTPLLTASSPSPSPAVQPPTSGIPTMTYIAIAAVIIIIAIIAAAVVLRRRK